MRSEPFHACAVEAKSWRCDARTAALYPCPMKIAAPVADIEYDDPVVGSRAGPAEEKWVKSVNWRARHSGQEMGMIGTSDAAPTREEVEALQRQLLQSQ